MPNLIEVQKSSYENFLQRVTPADPNNSYLIQKLEGSANIGTTQRMPFGGPPLDPATIAAIRQWISNGAPQ